MTERMPLIEEEPEKEEEPTQIMKESQPVIFLNFFMVHTFLSFGEVPLGVT